MKLCDCKDWKENVEVIDSALVLAFTHGSTESVKSFEFCPWCGKRLTDVMEDD
jgi:hypothetical protein